MDGELTAAAAVSLHGRRFVATQAEGGDVSGETAFDYGQDGDLIWARYAGGPIRLGHLAGTRRGDVLDFRYAHVTVGGETGSGHANSTVSRLPDGRLSLHEHWEWDSRTGAGTRVLEEIPSAGVLGLGFAATATLRQEQTVDFFERVLGLRPRDTRGVETSVETDAEAKAATTAEPTAEASLFVLPDGASFAVTSPRGIPGGRLVGFLVPNLDLARERLRAAGVDVGPTFTNVRERYVHFTAPDGETYELVERLTA